jgi:hypothetical protein
VIGERGRSEREVCCTIRRGMNAMKRGNARESYGGDRRTCGEMEVELVCEEAIETKRWQA